jgi:hypothetical protein
LPQEAASFGGHLSDTQLSGRIWSMEYVANIIKDKENVESATIYAHDDAEAYENARDWAAGLNLPRDDEVWLLVKTPDNSLKTFRRNCF